MAEVDNSAFAAKSVKLLIKASNQEFEDQIIDTQLLWTIRRLKTYLSQVYPSNPSVSEQKLIYSGQLLADNLLLKDVIRNYKDVDTPNHIFHLVYTPRNPLQSLSMKKTFSMSQQQQSTANFSYENDKPSTSRAATSNDGLRHRNVGGAAAGGTSLSADHQYSQLQKRQESKHQQQCNTNPFKSSQKLSPNSPLPSNENQSKSFVDIPEIMSNGQYPKYYHQPQNPHALQFVIPPQEDINAMIAQRDAMYNWLRKVYDQYQEQCLLLAKLPSYAQNHTIDNPRSSVTEQGEATAETSSSSSSSTTSPLIPKGSNANMAASNNFLPNPFFQQMPFLMQNIPPFGGYFPGMNPLATDFNGPSGSSSSSTSTSTAERVSSASSSTHSASTGTNPIQAVPVIQSTTTNTTATTPTTQTTEQATFSAQAEQQQAAAEGAEPAAAAAGGEQQIPRFPNIVEEEQDNRDWLDNFYSAIRLLALLTLVYFYSSPTRCLVVAIIAIGIYLYHNGFLHIRRPTEANNININNNRNDNPGANQIRQGVQEVQQHQQQEQQQQQSGSQPMNENTERANLNTTAVINNRGETLTSPPSTSGNIVPDNENAINSVIAFVQTFVVSFFTSLLPETTAL